MVRDVSMTIEELFRENNDREWVFVSPGGNQGDSMIYAGARKLADKAQLKYKEISIKRGQPAPQIDSRKIIYVQGGGGWCTWWNWTPRMVKDLSEKHPDNQIIIGPSTVAKQNWYIDKWFPKRKNMVFYARENTTYDYMKRLGVTLRRDHDTAFALEKGDRGLTPLLDGNPLKPFKLAAIREDPESPDSLPESVDLDYYDVVIDPCQTKNWGPLHLYATEILTNRSHSAILGAILGKKTKMFKGSYHKNKSIYDYSLKQMGVEWID